MVKRKSQGEVGKICAARCLPFGEFALCGLRKKEKRSAIALRFFNFADPPYEYGAMPMTDLKSHTNCERIPQISRSLSSGDPYGNRTHIFAVRGRRLNRLTKGP